MDKLKYIKLENEDGSYSNSIPLAVDSDHVDVNGNTLTNELSYKATVAEVDVERSRIDNLATLEEGSTTGDAELIDIRTGYDGMNYNNAGDAVRAQIANAFDGGMMKSEISVTWIEDKYINGTSGAVNNYTATQSYKYWASDWIKVDNLDKLIFKCNFRDGAGYAFYSNSKTFISGGLRPSGYESNTYITIDVPDNAVWFRFSKETIQNSEYNPTLLFSNYELPYGINKLLNDNENFHKQLDNFLPGLINGNLFTLDILTEGAYLNGDGYSTSESPGYGYTDFIEVKTNNLYAKNVFSLDNLLCCYDENKYKTAGGKISKYINEGLPSGTKYIRFNVLLNQKTKVAIYETQEAFNNELPYGKIFLSTNYIPNITNPINVYVGSSRLITNLVEAVESYRDIVSKKTPVNIYLDAGVYDVLTEDILENATDTFIGLSLPDYMNIYGAGTDQTIIKGELPVDISSYSFSRNEVSTLNIWLNNEVKNLTIIGKNNRYCLHNDDYKSRAVPDAIEIFENVTFIYEPLSEGVAPNTVSKTCVGIGAYNGRITKFINCICNNQNEEGRPFLLHNNIDSPKPCLWEFDTCDFKGGHKGFGISPADNNQNDMCIFKGCYLDKNIEFYPQTVYTQAGKTSQPYVLRGYGNHIPGYTYTNLTEDSSKIQII